MDMMRSMSSSCPFDALPLIFLFYAAWEGSGMDVSYFSDDYGGQIICRCQETGGNSRDGHASNNPWTCRIEDVMASGPRQIMRAQGRETWQNTQASSAALVWCWRAAPCRPCISSNGQGWSGPCPAAWP